MNELAWITRHGQRPERCAGFAVGQRVRVRAGAAGRRVPHHGRSGTLVWLVYTDLDRRGLWDVDLDASDRQPRQLATLWGDELCPLDPPADALAIAA